MPNDVHTSELASVLEIWLGHPFRGAIPEIQNGDVRVIQLRDLSRTGLRDCDALLTTTIDGRKEPDWVRDQDLVFVPRGRSNYAALVSNPPPRTVCSPHLYLMRVKRPDWLLPGFLAWQLQQPPAQRHLRLAAEGTLQVSIRRSELEKLAVRVPPIAQQRNVLELQRVAAAERSTYEALIKNREDELAAIAEQLLG
jgi:hypothetical protein